MTRGSKISAKTLRGEATHRAVDAESHVAAQRRHSNIDKVDPAA